MTRIQNNLSTQGDTLELNNYDCQVCKDREIVVVEVADDWVARECKCKEQKRMRRIIKSSGLTEELKKYTFGNFSPRPKQELMFKTAYTYVKDYPEIKEARCKGLAFTGTVGVGKTHLLAAIANNLLSKKIIVCFVNTPELIDELRESQFKDSNKMEKQLDIIKKSEVIIFDDLAKEKTSEWVQNQYYKIINHRYINGLATLFSTNCSMEELEDKLGDATASRLYAMTKDRLIHIVDDDYRMVE